MNNKFQNNNNNLIQIWNNKIQLTQKETDIIYEQMEETIKIFNELNINYHLIVGSALGQARHKGIIPWDDDIDFGIHEKDSDKLWKNRDLF